MNFKNWLGTIEEAGRGTVNRPSSSVVTDRSAIYGLAGQFGHASTQLPISFGYQNKAVASLISGIGGSLEKVFQKKGRSISPPANIADLPESRDRMITYGILPLQLPLIKSEVGDYQRININYSTVSKIIPDPMRDPSVVKTNQKFSDSTYKKPDISDFNQLEDSKQFTTLLLQRIIISAQSTETQKKYNFLKPRIERQLIKKIDGNEHLFLVFSFPRTVDVSDEFGEN